jgi:hypothetical protein
MVGRRLVLPMSLPKVDAMPEDDFQLPLPPGVLICEHDKPTNADVAEMWRFKEYVEDVAARGADTVHRDPKWRDYLGLSSEDA